MNIERYPLQWPDGWPRHRGHRESGSFQGTQGKVQEELILEINRLVFGAKSWRSFGADELILSTNVAYRKDGLPYANQPPPCDPGVAVYFIRKGKMQCFACDKYDKLWKNMRAIQRTIEALRGIERWGSSEMMDRAFTGFDALPAPAREKSPWEILGIPSTSTPEQIKARYRQLARERHPDTGGSHAAFTELSNSYETLRASGLVA